MPDGLSPGARTVTSSHPKLPDLYVLDAIVDDIENLDAVVERVNDQSYGWVHHWGRPFTREDVVAELSRLIRDECVQVAVLATEDSLMDLRLGQLPQNSYSDVWFVITPRGRIMHATWKP